MVCKITIGLLAAAVTVVAFGSLAGADPQDDTLSRTFPYISGAYSTLPVGWHDSAGNVCALPPVPGANGALYYDSLRVHYNLPGFSAPQAAGASLVIPFPCPAFLNPLCTVTCAIHVAPVQVGALARTLVSQDGIVCEQQASAFFECIPTAGRWWVDRCPWSSASFTQRAAGSNKGLLGPNLEHLVLSADIDCSNYAGLGYDYSFLLDNPLSSGFDGFPAAQVVPYNNGVDETGFVVSCLEVTYTTIDYRVPPPVISSQTGDGVDYELILDLDAPTNWVGALAKQISGNGVGGHLALQGLYDLGGNNDCDFPLRSPPPQCFDGVDNDRDGATDIQDTSPAGPSPAPPNTGTGGCWHLKCQTILNIQFCNEYYDASDATENP